MACYTVARTGQTFVQREAEVKAALRRLETYLLSGKVQVGIAQNGAIVFKGWTDSDDITDTCAYRSLSHEGSWALRQAVARAEAMSGRKVNAMAVAAGHHSHDGGKTWGSH